MKMLVLALFTALMISADRQKSQPTPPDATPGARSTISGYLQQASPEWQPVAWWMNPHDVAFDDLSIQALRPAKGDGCVLAVRFRNDRMGQTNSGETSSEALLPSNGERAAEGLPHAFRVKTGEGVVIEAQSRGSCKTQAGQINVVAVFKWDKSESTQTLGDHDSSSK